MADHGSSILSKHGAHAWGDWLNEWGVEPIILGPVVLFLPLFFASSYDPDSISGFLAALTILSPIWLPLFLLKIFWISWVEYIRYKFLFAQDPVLLEIQLPQEVEKSPLAMETFLVTLWNSGGETTFIARVIKGQYRPIWSLEIASNEGRVSFYLRIDRRAWKNIVEARLYGQFPEAKVIEVEDYVDRLGFNFEEYDIWGTEYNKGKPQALPIKTYRDWGLDKDPKEEQKVDPIANIIELLGQVGKDEYFWMQIVARAYKKDEWYGFNLKNESFKVEANAEVKKIMTAASKRSQEIMRGFDVQENRVITMLTETERNKIEAIEGALSKLLFETGIRVVYLAKREKFNGVNIGGMIRFFDAFRSTGYHNSLFVARGLSYFNYPWQDFMNIRKNKEKRDIFFRFKHRAFFFVPYNQVPIFLTTEELATLWHFPGSSVKTPGLNRVASRRAEAPPNLPSLPS